MSAACVPARRYAVGAIVIGTAAVLVSPALLTQSSTAREPAPHVRLAGTYLQLLSAHARWTDTAWRRLFASFRELGLTRLVVQWSVYDGRAFYATPGDQSARAPLETIMRLAGETGVEVRVGLVQDSQYWTAIRREPRAVAEYLATLRRRALATAQHVAPRLAVQSPFGGFYITEEIDDTIWRSAERRAVLFTHLRELSDGLHALAPDRPVAISGFATSATTPRGFEEFWSALLAAAPIDAVIFQDGVGARNLTLEHLPSYIDAIKRAVAVRDRRLEIVVEVFTETDDRRDIRTFRAVPAPLARITRQIEIAGRAGVPLIAFSVPDYMSPLGGRGARALYESYRRWLARPAAQVSE